MKEISIEEKAKRYDEKLDVARHIYADPSVKDEDKYYIEVIFPELRESEDERMRKHLIGVVELYYGNTDEQEKKDCLAWLEKQGEQKPAWSEEDELKIDFISKLILGLDQEKYDSQCMKELADWLKFLKDRYTWKPSEEQLEVLAKYVELVNINNTGNEVLKELLEQLKKL